MTFRIEPADGTRLECPQCDGTTFYIDSRGKENEDGLTCMEVACSKCHNTHLIFWEKADDEG